MVNNVFIFYLMVHGYNKIPIKFQLRITFEISCACYFSANMADKLLKLRAVFYRPCHTIAYRTSVCQRMKNITHTLLYAYIR